MAYGSYTDPTEIVSNLETKDISKDYMLLTEFEATVYDLAVARENLAYGIDFTWAEKDLDTDYTLINNGAGYTAAATDLVVDDASIFTVTDEIRNLNTDEVMYVSDVNTGTNTITVTRGIGETAGVAITDDDPILIIGNAQPEASLSPDENNAEFTYGVNYLQTFRKTFSLAGTLGRTSGAIESDYDASAEDVMKNMMREIEYALIFGKYHLDTTTNTKPTYFTGGAIDYIDSTNVEAVGGTLSEYEWAEFLADKAFAYGSKEKVFLCGPNYFKAFTYWSTQNYQVNIQADVGIRQGTNVGVYIAPTGETLIIINHELLRGDANLAGLGIVIDPAVVKLRYADRVTGTAPQEQRYKNGRLQFGEGIQENDRDGILSEYFAQIGLEIRDPLRHALITGVTGPTTS